MARSEARLSVTIWTDADFLALSPTAQRMFMFLISQPDLAHDGVLALRERRWSKKAKGMTTANVERDLSELRDTRFIVIDEDTEEVLIRSFIRRDKVYRQPNVLRAAADHLATVSSRIILAAVADELRRVASADDIHDGARPIVAAMLAAIGTPREAFENPSGNPSGRVPGPESTDQGDPDATETGDSDVTAGGNPSGSLREGYGEPLAKGIDRTPGERGTVTAVRRASPFPVPRSTDPDPRPQSSTGGRAGVRETPPARDHAGPPPEPDLINPTTAGTVSPVGHHGLQEGPADGDDPAPAASAAEPRGIVATPPPERCRRHLDDPDPPNCGPCADARKRRERYDHDQVAVLARIQSERARQQAEASRAAIDACRLCDDRGYHPDGRLCTHDPEQTDRVRRGAAAAAAAIRHPATREPS